MVSIDKATSEKLSALSFICACMVVLIHVPVPSIVLSPGWYMSEILSYGLCLIAVPSFYIMSGFFLGRHTEHEGWWLDAIIKRLRSLIIPYVIFNLLYLLWTVDLHELTLLHAIKSMIGSPFDYPTLGPLWYVRSLFLYVVISPLFARIKMGGVIFVYLVSAIFLIINSIVTDNLISTFLRYSLSLPNLPYFVAGIYLAHYKLHPIRKINACIMLIAAIMILFAKVVIEASGITVPMYWRLVFCPLLIASLWSLLPNLKLNKYLTTLSFPIYLLHYFFTPILNDMPFTSNSAFGFMISYIIMLFGAIITCVIIRKVFPVNVVKVLWGGR